MIRTLLDRSSAAPWSHGGKIPWNDPAFSERMLREHLSQAHDRASRRASVIDEQVCWIHEVLLHEQAVRLLDLGCGPGLYTSRLTALGNACLGIDFSPASIEYARAEASRNASACEYLLVNFEDSMPSGPFDIALMLFGELNAFPRTSAARILSGARAALGNDGRLVLEVHTDEAVRSLGAQAQTWLASASSLFAEEPHLMLRDCSWHEAESTAVERYLVQLESGVVSEFVASTRAYCRAGYRALLAEAGLREVESHPCLSGRSEALDPGLFVIVAAAA